LLFIFDSSCKIKISLHKRRKFMSLNWTELTLGPGFLAPVGESSLKYRLNRGILEFSGKVQQDGGGPTIAILPYEIVPSDVSSTDLIARSTVGGVQHEEVVQLTAAGHLMGRAGATGVTYDFWGVSTPIYSLATIPIGFIYVQLPGQSQPAAIWPEYTWTNVSNTYAGLFFRAEGGMAGEFDVAGVGCTWPQSQKDTIPEISGSFGHKWLHVNDSFNATGAFAADGGSSGSSCPKSGSTTGMGYTFRASRSVGADHISSEVRPINATIRIWKRTA
jgi:hypothetical protein